MWPILINLLRSNAAYITLPIAAVIGFVGYNIENLVSDKYTPYNKSIQEDRVERLMTDEQLSHAMDVQKLSLKSDVLGRNLSPSLQKSTTPQ